MGIFGRWSAYGSFGRTIRLIFFSSLLFSALLSICTCGYGLWLVQNRAEYAELLNPSLYVDVARIMIVVSIFALINACVSIWAITKEMRCMIYTTVTASFVIFVMLFIGGIMGFVFRQQLMYQIPLHVKMLTSLRELYGTPEMEGITSAWNELQTNFKCCGVNGTDDLRVWRTSKWYMRQKEPKRRIPMSCCATKDIGSCLKIDLQNPNRSFVYTDTCYELLKADLLSVTRSAAWLSITSSFVMLVPSIFATIYAKLIRK